MKKLINLKGANALNSNQQKSINGGGPVGPPTPEGPCGETGGKLLHCDHNCYCGGIVSEGCCWACY